MIATLLSQVQLERDGEIITRSTVRECVDVLLRLAAPDREGGKSVYVTDFEPEFLRRSGEFYKLEALDVLERGDSSLYLKNVRFTSSLDAHGRSNGAWRKKQIVQHITSPPSPTRNCKIF